MSETGLALNLQDANSRQFAGRLFGPSSLPAVFRVSFAPRAPKTDNAAADEMA